MVPSRSGTVVCVSLMWAALATIAAAAEGGRSSEPRDWPDGGPGVTEFTYVEANGLPKIGLLLQVPRHNMRNSEGDLIELKNGRILVVSCHFTGGITVTLWCKPDQANQSDHWMLNTMSRETAGYRLGFINPTSNVVGGGYIAGLARARFHGWLDDIRIYRRVLSSADIATLARAES